MKSNCLVRRLMSKTIAQGDLEIVWTTTMRQLVQLGSLQPLRWMVLRLLCSTVLKFTTLLSDVVTNRQVCQSGGKVQPGRSDGNGARHSCCV